MNASFPLLLLLLAIAMDSSVGTFVSELVSAMGKGRYEENILFSPVSIQQTMGVLFLGARGESATELQSGLELSSHTDSHITAKFSSVFGKTLKEGATLNIANRLYFDEKYDLSKEFESLAKNLFHATAVPVAKYKTIGADINSWVEQQTANKVQSFISDDGVWNERVLLVNDVYFKAKWSTPFPKGKTREYHSDSEGKKTFNMMSRDSEMLFGTLKDLDAYAAVITLKGTDIAMLVLLPRSKQNGLAALEAKLKDVDLTQLPQRLRQTHVTLMVPKFRFEYDMSLKPQLEGIGLKTIFGNAAFCLLSELHSPVAFTEIRHKAYIEINEDGIEIAAASAVCSRHRLGNRQRNQLNLLLVAALLLLLLLLAIATSSSAGTISFASKLVNAIAKERANENLGFSPASIQHSLALLYLGAEGKTAAELRAALQLSSTKEDVAQEYSTIFDNLRNDDVTFKVSSRLYVDTKLEIAEQFKNHSKTFKADLVSVEFGEVNKVKKHISDWVGQETVFKVKDLITDRTDAVLVDNIYFKADWLTAFSKSRTREVLASPDRKTKVHLMIQENAVLFKEFDSLNANVAQVKLKGTDIAMLVMLPNENTGGLAALEDKLKDVDLTQLPEAMRNMSVTLLMPKFTVEFDMSLKAVLEKNGMKRLFNDADFSSLLTSNKTLFLSDIRHKGFVKVDEEGVELAIVTGANAYPPEVQVEHEANHSFFFAFLNKKTVYFAGHMAYF